MDSGGPIIWDQRLLFLNSGVISMPMMVTFYENSKFQQEHMLPGWFLVLFSFFFVWICLYPCTVSAI